MQYQQFIQEVADRGHFTSIDEARHAADAVFVTLAQRLDGTHRDRLTEILPPTLAESARHVTGSTSPFVARQFVDLEVAHHIDRIVESLGSPS
jgi:uncharacterized protein (DUF2267 family)